ncbi:MAG: hypothetical protein ACRC6S_07240 [Shewanella sp.]
MPRWHRYQKVAMGQTVASPIPLAHFSGIRVIFRFKSITPQDFWIKACSVLRDMTFILDKQT